MNDITRMITRVRSTLGRRTVAWGNDLLLGIETSDAHNNLEHDPAKPWPFSLIQGKPKHADSIIYGAAEYISLRRAIRALRPASHDVVFDLGCGKGRVICEFARHHVQRVVGVELNKAHCAVARRNAVRLRGRKSPIEIRCEDAATTDISNCTILFMANPFGPDTIREVLQNLRASLEINPRMLQVVYYTPRYLEAFQACDWLQKQWEMSTLGGGDTIVGWGSRPG